MSKNILGHEHRSFLKVLLWDLDYKVFEWFNGIAFLGLGLGIIYQSSTQQIINYSIKSFTIFSAQINVIHVAVGIMLMFAFAKFTALIVDEIRLRKWVALAGVFMWGTIFALFANYPIKVPSLIFIIQLTAFSLWTFIRLVLRHRAIRRIDPRDPLGQIKK